MSIFSGVNNPGVVLNPLTTVETAFLVGLADHSYTDGQLIIGNGATGGVSFSTLTQGTGITITNGHGTITIASSAGAANLVVGTSTITSGTSGRLLYDNGGVVGEALLSYSAATFQLGDVDAASPVAQTVKVQNVVAGTSNTVGADLTVLGSQGTGNAAGGQIIFKTAPAGTSGTSQNAQVQAFKIRGDGKTIIGSGTGSANMQLRITGSTTGTEYGLYMEDGSGNTSLQVFNSGSVVVGNSTTSKLSLGGTTSSFPMLKASGTTLLVRLADDSNYTGLAAQNLIAISQFQFNGGAKMGANSTTGITLFDSTSTTFGLLQFGGTTSSFPAIKRNGAAISFRTADDSADANISANAVSAVNFSASGQFQFAGSSRLLTIGDGIIRLSNNATTDFTRLNFGGDTSSFPSIKKNGTALNFRLADDSADTTATMLTQSQLDGSNKGATTLYVDTAVSNAIAAVNPAMAVQVATTAAGDTSSLTYIHVAGIGDTFTGSLNTAITIDGHTLVLGDRVLIKNDTQTTGGVSAGVFNGIYSVTTIQTVGVAPVLTRVLDYDTPSDINNTGAIPVILGTVNATTSWLLTSSVSAVGTGTNVLTYTQFSRSPTAVLSPTLGGTGVANNSASTITLASAKTLTVNNSLTFAGTDSTTMTFPGTSASVARTDAAQTFTGTQTFSQIVTTNNAITATSNAATVPITSRISTVTNSSAATLTITITTTSAVDGQMIIVRVLDFSGVAQTITWVNTENSTVTAPTTSNGSTTLPLTVGFQFNNATTKWRCIASA